MDMLKTPDQGKYRTKTELVYIALRTAIMQCDILPGARLIIDEISDRLHVSHIPVREAISQLQSEGLVTVVPHSGARVAMISPGEVVQIFSIMEGLENVAVRIVAERVSDDDLKRLSVLIEQMDTSAESHDTQLWAEQNIEFHREIAALTDMPLLQEMTNHVMDRWDRVRRFVQVLPERLIEAQQQHHEIVRALKRRDVTSAQALATLHNRGAMAAYQSRLNLEQKVGVASA